MPVSIIFEYAQSWEYSNFHNTNIQCLRKWGITFNTVNMQCSITTIRHLWAPAEILLREGLP